MTPRNPDRSTPPRTTLARTTLVAFGAALTVSSVGAPAQAFRASPTQRPAQPLRVAPPSAIPTGPAPTREVRQVLRELGPDLDRCAATFGMPGEGPRRRLRVRTWLYPETGAFTAELPELDEPTLRGRHGRTRQCIHAALVARMRPHMRRFRARTRLKIERAFVVHMPGPPPSAAQLARDLRRERAALLRCVPGAGRRGESATLVLRVHLARSGQLSLVGLGAPAAVPFEAAQACVTSALAEMTRRPVTADATFETSLSFRWEQAATASPGAP